MTAGRWWPPLAVWALVGLAHAAVGRDTEPFRNNDETRHVMTGVFVRDALFDLPHSAVDPTGYAVRYYAQHPALGLLVWPPLFYLGEGLAMAALGPGYPVARGLLALHGLVVLLYAYRLAARGFGRDVAVTATALLAVGRLVAVHSRYVLLEVPTLGWVLASVWHFERYLDAGRRRDALLAGLFAAAAALTRFDGVVLLPYFAIRLLTTRNLRVLGRPAVLGSAALAAGLAGPYYLLTYREYAAGLSGAGVAGTSGPTDRWANLLLYPRFVPDQVGWVTAGCAAAGLVLVLRRHRRAAGPSMGLLAATYVTFVPLAEPEPRHAIYWVPGVCTLAAVATQAVGRRFRPPAAGAIVVSAGLLAFTHPQTFLRGYRPAAEFVAAHASGDRPVLFDGILGGDFVYQLRLCDPGRRLWVVRGDKLLYASLSDPAAGYTEYARTDAEVLDLLHRADPEYVVIEAPPLPHTADPVIIPGAERLRRVLEGNPDRFRLVRVMPLDTNHEHFWRTELRVYHKPARNPAADRTVAVPVLGLGGRRLGAAR